MTDGPNLYGVWAKWNRGLEQLQAFHKEVLTFGKEPHAYTVISQENEERGEYVYAFKPAWPADKQDRWGAITGEIIHDFRSALDQLVCRLVELNGGTVTRDHSCPLRTKEPADGFRQWATNQWTDKRGRPRHGALFGLNDDALALIESAQPYQGRHGALLRQLHDWWNLDKHETLVPTTLVFPEPTIHLTNAVLMYRQPGRFVGDTYVIEFSVAPSDPTADTHVDVEPHAPVDVRLENGRAVIEELRAAAKIVLLGLLTPAVEMFPPGAGMRMPV